MKTFAFLRQTPKLPKIGGINLDRGQYNGYVGIVEGTLPESNMSLGTCFIEGDVLDFMVRVHGGITFDSTFPKDEPIIPLTEIPADWWQYRVIGFDTAHFNDTAEFWNYEECRKETLDLREQIEKLINA